MLLALLWSSVPAYFLGKAKEPLARALHEKVLYADATNKADWLLGLAAIAGILGIGVGWWWADSAVAGTLSFDIAIGGYKNLRQAVFNLVNQVPQTVSRQEEDPILKQLERQLSSLGWVRSVRVRLREEGHIFSGDAFIIANDVTGVLAKIKTTAQARGLDWRLKDLVIAVVEEFPE